MAYNPGDTYEYDGLEWTVSLVTKSYITIERGNKWLTLRVK